MDIILKQEVERLGSKHEIVRVKNGFARNFLIPQGYAIAATESARKVVAETLRQQSHKAAKATEDAREIAEKIAGITLRIGAKAGESGKIFGSVNNIQLADAFSKEGFTIERRAISILEEPIRDLGSYKAKVRLHKEVIVEVSFEVVAE
jgi:large subunit ribosomal protein L9|tara:strand:- start:659 stop:1105 length:447 start_codon:yes stop_codon:yes gene_type:complete